MGFLGPRSLLGVVREVRGRAGARGPLVVGGARELVPLLAREFRSGGDVAAVVEHGPFEGAAALVWLGDGDEDVLRRASRAGLAIVGVTDGASLPYVLDSNLVRLPPGQGLPLEAISEALAHALGPDGVSLAARLPLLRPALVDALIDSCARRNGLIAAAVFVPGADLPVLTLNELRLVLRVALAHGEEIGLRRLPEVVGVVGAGYGARRLARGLVGSLPVAGFALKGAVAFGATRAIGEAARTRFAGGDPSVR